MKNVKAVKMLRAMKEYADESSWIESEGGFVSRNGTKFKYKLEVVN